MVSFWWWKASLVTLLLGVSISDASHRRVSNALSATLLTFAVAFWGVHVGATALAFALGGAAGAFALLLAPYALGLVAAGDVKVFAACGAAAGAAQLGALVLWSLLATGLLSLVYLATWRATTPLALLVRLDGARGALQRGRASGETLPLAVALSVGLLLTLKGSAAWQL